MSTIYCASCRRASCGCGSTLGFVRVRASLLRAGDEIIEADGALLPVDSVAVRPNSHVEIALRPFGPSRVGPITCHTSRVFSVATVRR